jgi:hypothetical protein
MSSFLIQEFRPSGPSIGRRQTNPSWLSVNPLAKQPFFAWMMILKIPLSFLFEISGTVMLLLLVRKDSSLLGWTRSEMTSVYISGI